MTRPFLLIDADDTLWENNIYFERAFEEFVAFLDHSSLSPGQIRSVLDEIEEVNSRVHGYGSLNFGRNLRQCYQHLAERDVSPEDLDTVMGFAQRILECPMEVIEGVPDTLEYLSLRCDLTLFTKGNPEEQKLKIGRSGLGAFFSHTSIVKEKDAAAYLLLVEERKLEPERTWMIGNSPKSDINPALEAGLGAVFIPHARTWILERQEVRTDSARLLILERFGDLRKHF
ncbi:Haloacid dehalogenase domain protein hydrolase [Candidatus Sulfopaludibacter sp. SbA3]|nr:Haloacid dehalogenase domain protein hydrolase [Candidatus Sulfopaludibacter sp. SbA3]